MEKDNEIMKSKKKFPLSLIVCLAIVICALGAIGVKVLKVEDTNSGKETTKEIIVSDGDEIKVSDEETLRELLAKEETLSLVIKKDIYTSKPFAINGTKTLNGEGSIIMRLDAEAKKDLCVVSKGAELILDGATIDGNGVATGVHVQSGGKFKGLSGEILYGMPYGIQTAGVVEIEDITIDRAMHTALLVSTGGEAYMTGGKITNCIETGIAVAMKAYAKISGNAVLEGSAGSLAYNYGVLDITGGKLSGSTANTIFNKSELNIISESDKLVEICDSKGSAISAVGGTTVNIDGLYIHDVAKHGLNLEKEGTGVVKNCTIERLGRMGLYVATSSVMEIENVTIKEGKYRGIVNNDGTVMVKNTDISDMEGAGIVTAGKKSVTTLEDIKIAKVAKSGLGITGGKVTAKNLNISDAAGSGINITTEASTSEITNAKVTKSGKNGIAMTIGTLTAKNIAIDGSKDNGVYLKAKAVANLTDTTIKNSEIHAVGNYGGKLTSKNLTIEVTEKGGIVSKGGTVNCDTTTISKTGSRAVNLLEGCQATMTALKIKDAGNTAVYADGGSVKLTDYEVDQVKGHGIYLMNSEKMMLQNGKVSNTTRNGVYVGEKTNVTFEDTSVSNVGEQGFALYRGTVTVRNLTIEETGKGGMISDGGTIKGNTVAISKTGSRGISLKNNATANIKILEIAEAGGVGAWVEDSVGNFTEFTIDSAKKTGVSVEGTGNSYLKDGVINALAKGVFVNTGAVGEANNLKVYRMKGNAEPLIDVYIDGTFTLKNAESLVEGNGLAGRGMRVNGKVTMKDGTIRNNNFVSEKNDGIGGGGVYIGATGKFVMDNGTIEKNATTENGAGVYVRNGGSFTLNKGTIQDNQSDKAGAGVAVVGTMTMKDGVIQGNSTKTNAAGILVSKDATFKMSGGIVTGNAAGKGGGGLFVQSDKVTVSGGKITSNTATENGSGVYVHSGKLTMTGGTVSEHGTKKEPTNSVGAGVYVRAGATFDMDGAKASVANNYTTRPGAGVAVYGTFNLKNGVIQENNTTGNAAGIFVGSDEENKIYATFTMTGGTVTGNTAGKGGGGLFIQSENASIIGGEITGNIATEAGSGVNINAGKLIMTGGSISGHGTEDAPTENNGAGVYVNAGARFEMNGENATVENNHSTKSGAGVAVYGTFNLKNGKIQNNTTTGNAAGILVNKVGSFAMTGGNVTDNIADGKGGGIYVQSESNDTEFTTNIHGGSIAGNEAANGAGIYVDTNKNVSIKNVTIESNAATESGGGVYVNRAKSCVMGEGSLVASNTAVNGGGVYIIGSGTFKMENGSITANISTGSEDDGKAVAGMGSGVYVGEPSSNSKLFEMTGGTISGHGTTEVKSNSLGAGVYVASGAKFEMNGENAIVENNHSTKSGAGVAVYGTFNLKNGKIQNNTTTANAAGILVNKIGVFSMTGGTITGNVADGKGGGIYIQSESDDAEFTTNIHGGTITANGAANGAGIYVDTNKNVSIKNVTMQSNIATENGGGVYVHRAKSCVMGEGSLVASNTAVNGGGVYIIGSGTFKMENGSITANISTGSEDDGKAVAGMGSGVYVGEPSSNSKLFEMTGGTISGHGTADARSNGYGAGVYVASGAKFEMNGADAVIKDNFSNKNGAGVAVSGTFTMSKGTIQGNNTTANGAGVYILGTGSFTMSGGTITSNTATNGGGVYQTGDSNASMSGGTITNNTATGTQDESGKGSGVYVATSKDTYAFTMTGGNISGHGDTTASNVVGAGVYVETGSHFKLQKNGEIKDNHTTANGAGIAVAGKLSMSGGTIKENTTTADGGGVYVLGNGVFNMNTTTSITYNEAVNGGGVYHNGQTFNMKKGTISSNKATNGGGVYVNSQKFEMTTADSKTITGNTATAAGAGVYVNAGTFDMQNGTISNHGTSGKRSAGKGAVYVASGATFEMNGANAVIKDNFSNKNGAGVYVDSTLQADNSYLGGTFNLKNGKIQGNNTSENGGGIYLNNGVNMTMTGGLIGGTGTAVNKATKNGGAICAVGCGTITLQAGEISGNTADGNVKGVFLQNAYSISKVILHTGFVMGNEIRFNNLDNRESDKPALEIVGDLTGTLNLGFHNNGTVYIKCSSAAEATDIDENNRIVNFYAPSYGFSYTAVGEYLKVEF